MAGSQSSKRALIDKANARIVIVVGIAAAITAFSMVATKALVSQATYQNRVIDAKREAVNQLKDDISAVDTLKTSYNAFVSTAQNALGGNPEGAGRQDGDNAKIILDALPSAYDFPSLTTNLETLLSGLNVKINSISGTDDEVSQSENQSSVNPEPIAIPFNVSVTGSYTGLQNVISAFERSIRPIQVMSFDITGADPNNLSLVVQAQTYYQPGKSLNIQTKVVK